MRKSHANYKKPLLIAHRGASIEAPENTFSAFQAALNIGVDVIEIDVRITKDGYPMVIHDSTVTRTTGNKANLHIHELTLNQIRALDAGSWFNESFIGEKIPTLDEVLLLVKKQAALMIEIKRGPQPTSKTVETILKSINQYAEDQSILHLGSFSAPIIEELQKSAPHLRNMGIVEKGDEIDQFLALNVKHLAIWHRLITPFMIESFHQKGIEIWTFTVDDPKVANHLGSIGIEGIISNDPRSLRDEYKKKI